MKHILAFDILKQIESLIESTETLNTYQKYNKNV